MAKNNKRPTIQTSNDSSRREALGMVNLVVNTIRDKVFGKRHGAGNSLYETFGYKEELTYDDFYKAYKRQNIAGRIIDAIVDFTWKDFPIIVDDEESAQFNSIKPGTSINELKKQVQRKKLARLQAQRRKAIDEADLKTLQRCNDEMASIESVGIQYTPFEEAVYDLQEKFPLLKIMKRADTMNCIGRFSIIVIGTGVEKSEDSDFDPNDMKRELPRGTSVDDITLLVPYSEEQVTISQWELDPASPRYGLPKMYSIQVKGDGMSSINYQVHWTRVIHIAEDLLDSEVYGTPKLQRVYNDLQDLLKVVGGSAEMFWLGAFQGLVFNVKDGYDLQEDDAKAITEQIENYVNKIQRFIKTQGIEVSTLSSPVADPRGNFEVLMKLISGSSNVPIRILLGAENGMYAGDTDQDTFYSYINARRNSHAEETIIRPLLDRLVEYGYIPAPIGGSYYVKWPELFEQKQSEKLNNAKLMIDTIKAATPFGNALDLVTIEEVRTAVGLDPEIPDTQYDSLMEEADYAIPGEIDALPNEPEEGELL